MNARIRVDPVRSTGPVDPRIYSHFIEHVDGCVYGGLLDSKFRPRREVLDLIRALHPPVVRWPGGLFADEYHWEDGIGAPERRPVRKSYWRRLGRNMGPPEPNQFGTDEFLGFCRDVGTEPYVNVNVGTGSPEEAGRWVEYAKGRKPRVKLWGIGNELYGWWATGHMGAGEYGRRFVEFSKTMRAVDPDAELVAVGADPRHWPDWNRAVLEGAGREADHLAVHFYFPVDNSLWVLLGRPRRRSRAAFLSLNASPLAAEERLRAAARTVEASGARAKLALDEWNVLWSLWDHWRWDWTWQEGLWAAGMFHALHRLGPAVSLGNYAQLVNLLGLIRASDSGVFTSPVYSAFQLYRDGFGEGVAAEVRGPTCNVSRLEGLPARKGVPLLDASAVREGGTLRLFVINRHPAAPVAAEVDLVAWEFGRVEARQVAPGAWAGNTAGESDRVAVKAVEAPGRSRFTFSFPAASATRFDFAP
ncbi:MAG: alpha-L-arabinofuranosidase C-terminal domain-containing protein [Halobacteria archaeon]